jgi:hypothetical protein
MQDGRSRTYSAGRLPCYPGEVWYNPDGIANILSLVADAEKHFCAAAGPERNGGARNESGGAEHGTRDNSSW